MADDLRRENAAGRKSMQWFDRIPTSILVVASLVVGLAPFVPEPHSLEKLRLLVRGELNRPIDIFDLFMHLLPLLLLILQAGRKIVLQNRRSG